MGKPSLDGFGRRPCGLVARDLASRSRSEPRGSDSLLKLTFGLRAPSRKGGLGAGTGPCPGVRGAGSPRYWW
jgi:hypothetical protein